MPECMRLKAGIINPNFEGRRCVAANNYSVMVVNHGWSRLKDYTDMMLAIK